MSVAESGDCLANKQCYIRLIMDLNTKKELLIIPIIFQGLNEQPVFG